MKRALKAAIIAAALAIAWPVWAAELPAACGPAQLADPEMRGTCEQLAKTEEAVLAYSFELAKTEARADAARAILTALNLLEAASGPLSADGPTAQQLFAQADAVIDILHRATQRLEELSTMEARNP